ncbi:MAG: response regulator [Anaerolineaceae bacterium]|nr:response regulator [Anaerolineaceae bacterium]
MTVVLVAEDDVDIRKLIAMALRLQQMEVVEAFDGQDALDKTIQENPDIVLLDITMPHLNGFEVCEKIRQTPSIKQTPVIFISAKIEQSELATSRSLGVDTVIEKPFDFLYLISKINELVNTNGAGSVL